MKGLKSMKRPKKPPMEFSKKILLCAAVLIVFITLGTFAAVWRFGDLSPLEFLIAGAFSLATAGTSFYYWKARRENELKISMERKQLGLEPPTQDDDG